MWLMLQVPIHNVCHTLFTIAASSLSITISTHCAFTITILLEYSCSVAALQLRSSNTATTKITKHQTSLHTRIRIVIRIIAHIQTTKMCYITRTRYLCTHLSPNHPASYTRPSLSQDKAQYNPKTEWPTHPHTHLEGCQDACRRGARCSGQLEELETLEKKDDGICEECEEKLKKEDWVIVTKEEEDQEDGGK